MGTKTKNSSNIVEQIAEKLNISTATVYAILANRKSCYASQRLKEQVKKLAEELGYRPNYIAAALKKGKTGTIGLIVSDMRAETSLFRIERITRLALEDNCHVFVGCTYDDPSLEEELLEEFYCRRVDGIAIAMARISSENKFLKELIKMRFPLMSFTHSEEIDIDYVSTDYFAGGYSAGEHLLNKGYTKIGIFGPQITTMSIKERFEGFKKALDDNGYNFDDSRLVVVKKETEEEIEKGAEKLLETDVDGVFCSNDRLALFLMKRAIKKGKKIPEELGIIGFDNTESGRMCLIPLTSIRQRLEETTFYLYEVLKKKIQGNNQSCRLLIKPELIERESTKRR